MLDIVLGIAVTLCIVLVVLASIPEIRFTYSYFRYKMAEKKLIAARKDEHLIPEELQEIMSEAGERKLIFEANWKKWEKFHKKWDW